MTFNPQLRHPRRFQLARGPLIAVTALSLGASALLWSPGVTQVARAQETAGAEASAAGRSYRLFYEKLATDGDWLETDQYGYVFQPRVANDDRAWRPYTDGYWAQTNAGWTWVSNEPFGWACYHYGRWANLVDVGWVWVPGSEWAPSYVSWRVSKDRKHVGWAPLPPEARLRKGAAIERWADSAYDIGPEAYVFINTNEFGENSYRTHLLPAERTGTIITETENVTNVSYRTVENRSIIYGGGPDVTFIREGTGRPVREFQLETRAEPVTYFQGQDTRGITSINGNRLVIATAAPDVITSTNIRVTQPATVRQRLNTITVDRGYRGAGDPGAIERVRTTWRAGSPPPPPEIQREASAAIQRTVAPGHPGNAAAARGAATPAASGAANPSPAAGATPATATRPATGGPVAPSPTTPAAAPSATPATTAARPSAPAATPAETPHAAHSPGAAKREDARSAATPATEAHGAATPKVSPTAPDRETPAATPAAKHHGEQHADKPTPPAAREEKPDAPKRPASEPPAATPEQPKAKPQRAPADEARPRGEGAAPERHREPAPNPAAEGEKKPKAEAAPHERRAEAPTPAAPHRAEPEARPAAGGGAATAPTHESKREKPEAATAPGQGTAKPSPQP